MERDKIIDLIELEFMDYEPPYRVPTEITLKNKVLNIIDKINSEKN